MNPPAPGWGERGAMIAGIVSGVATACILAVATPLWPPAAILIGMVAGGLAAAYRSKR